MERVRVMLIEEFHLLFIFYSMFIEEVLEGRIGFFKGTMLVQELIIVGSFVPVGQNLKSFGNLLKLDLGRFPMLSVFVWMPSRSKLLIGAFYLKE